MLNKIVRNPIFSALCLLLLISPVMVSADCAEGKLCNPLSGKVGSVEGLVQFLIEDILVKLIAPIVVTLAIIWSGFKFIMAQGKSSELEEARRTFLYVIIGSAILLGAYVIFEVVLNTVKDFTG